MLEQGFIHAKMASSRMHVLVWAALFCLMSQACAARVEDNEFAEFEQDGSVEGIGVQTDESVQTGVEDDDDSAEEAVVEDPIDDEFEEIVERQPEAGEDGDDDEAEVEVEDEEEEEDDNEFEESSMGLKKKGGRADDIKLSSADVQTSHKVEEYITEILVAVGMTVYLLNYIYGRSKNAQFAQAW